MAEMIDPSVVKEASAIFQDEASDISDSGTDAAVDDFGDGSVSDMGDADSLEDCICRGCDDPVLAEAVKKAARAVFGEGIASAVALGAVGGIAGKVAGDVYDSVVHGDDGEEIQECGDAVGDGAEVMQEAIPAIASMAGRALKSKAGREILKTAGKALASAVSDKVGKWADTLAADDGDGSADDDGDVMNEGIMGKLGKAAAGVALAAGLSHGAMHNSHDTSAQPSGKQVCSTVVKNVWQDPDYGDLEAKYLQEELQKQRDEVASGQRARVDEQRAYTMAQTHAIQDIAQKQCKTAKR